MICRMQLIFRSHVSDSLSRGRLSPGPLVACDIIFVVVLSLGDV